MGRGFRGGCDFERSGTEANAEMIVLCDKKFACVRLA